MSALQAGLGCLQVNCRGAWLCTQAAARLMQPQRKGSIINVGTVAAINRALPFEDASYRWAALLCTLEHHTIAHSVAISLC